MFSYYDLGDDDLPGCFAGLIFHTVNTWTVLPSLSHCYEHCSDSKERLMSSQHDFLKIFAGNISALSHFL